MELGNERRLGSPCDSPWRAIDSPIFLKMPAGLGYDDFVVIAEEEVKFYLNRSDALLRNSIHLADMDWECTFDRYNHKIKLECKDVMERSVAQVQMELQVYGRADEKPQFTRLTTNAVRHLFCERQKFWEYDTTWHNSEILLTLRVFKKRLEFPTFAAARDVPKSNDGRAHCHPMVKLRVGSRVFQVNKQLLASVSPYFDRMFNGDFVEAKSEEIELKAEELADPDIFHDFLLIITTSLSGDNSVLPKRQNVASLLKMAKFCQVDILLKKCAHHLKFCREMPPKERIFLCQEYGLKDARKRIVRDISTIEECKQLFNAVLDEEMK